MKQMTDNPPAREKEREKVKAVPLKPHVTRYEGKPGKAL